MGGFIKSSESTLSYKSAHLEVNTLNQSRHGTWEANPK